MRLWDAIACIVVGFLLGTALAYYLHSQVVADLEVTHLADLTYLSAVASDCDRELRSLEDLSERDVCLGLLERNVVLETEVIVLKVRLDSAGADCLVRIAQERMRTERECE
jgi:hypothetical protein